MKTLVLLHGWGASGAIWQRQVQAFGGECRVLTPEISRWDADWLTEYLAAVPLRESVLVGWSLGGMLLLEALARLKGPAPLATVLVGVAPVFCRRPDHPWGQPVAAVRAMRRALRSDPRRVINDFARACLAPGEEIISAGSRGRLRFRRPPRPTWPRGWIISGIKTCGACCPGFPAG